MKEKLKGLGYNGEYIGKNIEKIDYGIFVMNELKFGKFIFV